MESFPLFFKIRAATFMCIMLFSFLWLVLLCVEMFTRWSVSDRISHLMMILLLLANAITLIMLPLLILVRFRIWLDAARLLLLLVLQVGPAAAGTRWSSKIQCPHQTPDDFGVCRLINVYTMMAFWIIPTILVFYSTYFIIVVYLQSRIPVVVKPTLQERRSGDPETGSAHTLSLGRENLQEAAGGQGSNSDAGAHSESLVTPTMVHVHRPSHSQLSASQHQSPHRQSTMPSFPHKNQQPLVSSPLVASHRHRSLPAFRHSARAGHLPPLLTLSVSHPHATSVSASHPQTPSSCAHSIPSPASSQSQSFGVGPSLADVKFSKGRLKHLSLMPMPLSPREALSAEEGSMPRPVRTRLSKPLPARLL